MITRLSKNLGRISAKAYSLKDNKSFKKNALIGLYSFAAIDLMLDAFISLPMAVGLYLAGYVSIAIYIFAGVLLFNLAVASLLYSTALSPS